MAEFILYAKYEEYLLTRAVEIIITVIGFFISLAIYLVHLLNIINLNLLKRNAKLINWIVRQITIKFLNILLFKY